jgi:sugar/nucleoside kinase (ribokinase family)
VPLSPAPEYLLIGHITQDRSQEGDRLGGTVAYAGLTARAYGADTRILTTCREDLDLSLFDGISVCRLASAETTTFENRYTGERRDQHIRAVAGRICLKDVPESWRMPDIVHVGPVAGEIDPALLTAFPHSLIGLTLQGWMRTWGPDGTVRSAPRDLAREAARAASVVVFSMDDIHGSELEAKALAKCCPIAVATEGALGCRVYWNGKMRAFPAPPATLADPTGAGDIFAALFFLRLLETHDPYEAARVANRLAALSVTRSGLEGVPAHAEILEAKTVVEAQ